MNEINSNRNLNDVTKIKKNGIVDKNILSTSSNILKQGGIIFFAVDSIYGILATLSDSKFLIFSKICNFEKYPINENSVILSEYSKYVDYTVIVDDICKEHSLPSVIDIRSDKLSVVYEGRILSDDIRSLFFLGKMN